MVFLNALRFMVPWLPPAEDTQVSALIERLSYLSAEGERLSELGLGLEVWAQKVRANLEGDAPEFLPKWDTAEGKCHPELLREVIRELRGRL